MTTTTAAPIVIDKPGVYDIPAHVYHGDPVPGGSLSSTGARKLLPPSCPALFKHWLEHGQAPKDEFDFGSAAHRLVLGVGAEIAEIKADSWRSPATREEADEHRAAGRIPLLSRDVETVHAMADALRAHPIASALFRPGTGRAEQTLVWREIGHYTEGSADHERGFVVLPQPVHCRALVDWLPSYSPNRGERPAHPSRLLLPDYKTCASAAPDDAVKSIARYGYHIQGAFYLAGLRALGLADESARFLLVMQEKTAPYLVTVIEPDATAMRLGARRCREAIDTYARCAATGRWPGYSDDVVLAELPPWETRELEGQIW